MIKQRTPAFIFTADVMSSADMQQIAIVRKTVKTSNAMAMTAYKQQVAWGHNPSRPAQHRVCLKARLGKGNPYAYLYANQYIKSIKLEDARTIDVYVQTR